MQQRRAEARAKAKELMRRERERRKAGGQPGHRGAGRELKPEDQVDEIVDHYPDACGGCGRRFDDEQRRPGGRFGRHQVVRVAADQRDLDRASHPSVALPALSRADQRPVARADRLLSVRAEVAGGGGDVDRPASDLPPRGSRELARDLFGVTLSTGAVDAICQRASDALAGPHLQLQDWVLDQDAVHVDETGWRTRGEGRALWTATTPDAAFLQIAEHCNREQFNALIGTAIPGIVVSDRWNGYSHLDPTHRQVCWSHLQRDFRRHADGLAEQKTFGEQRPRAHRPGVRRVARLPARAPRPRPTPGRDRADPDRATSSCSKHACPKSRRTRWHRQFANNLLKIWPALWTFTTIDGVEPTNNPAERALRAPVIHRKLSLGTQSDNGERFAERALSAAATCRLQHRSLFTYLSELITAHNRGDPFPALA